jgi:hypothetical protein
MGRHSAVDDDDEVNATVVVESPAPAGRHGRHVFGEDTEATGPLRATDIRDLENRATAEDHQPTEPLAAVDSAPADLNANPAPAAAKRRPRGSQSTAADLALLRRRPDVRNRVIAAVVVPFVLYVAVMLLIGAAGGQYLLWVWIPLVSAGVGGGLILDRAHRKHPPDGAG